MKNVSKKAKAKPKGKPVPRTTTVTGQAVPRVISSRSTAVTGQARTKMAHTHASCSILDPFCIHAKGAKRPDGLGSQSIAYQIRETISIDTILTTGRARVNFVPGNGVYGYGVSTYASPSFTTPATWTAFASSAFVSANAGEVRLVSFGVRLVSILSATAASGYVIIGTTTNSVVGNVQSQGRTNYVENSIRPLTSGFETAWISKPTGSTVHSFKPISLVVNNMADFDWTGLSVEIVGGPTASATPCLIAEVYMNVECVLNENPGGTGGYAQLSPPAKPANPVATTVQAIVHSGMPSIFEGPIERAGKAIEAKAGTIVSDVLSGAMAFLGL